MDDGTPCIRVPYHKNTPLVLSRREFADAIRRGKSVLRREARIGREAQRAERAADERPLRHIREVMLDAFADLPHRGDSRPDVGQRLRLMGLSEDEIQKAVSLHPPDELLRRVERAEALQYDRELCEVVFLDRDGEAAG